MIYLATTSGTTGYRKIIPITKIMKTETGRKLGFMMYYLIHCKARLKLGKSQYAVKDGRLVSINDVIVSIKRSVYQPKFDVLIFSLNLFHSHGTAYMNERSRKVLEQSLLIGGIIFKLMMSSCQPST